MRHGIGQHGQQCDTKKTNLAGDMIDQTSNNKLHCVLEGVMSSEPFETTSTESFTRPGHTVFSKFFATGFLLSCNGRVRAWISVLGVLHLKRGEFDEPSGVHLDSGEKLGEVMLVPSGALKIVSSTEPCMLASEDHASRDT